jgi:regulatory protein
MDTNYKITPQEALSRLQKLCSIAEKCTGDAREKLRKWNIPETETAFIIEKLTMDKFIDDHRYAEYFVRDKQKINKWGKEKIRYALSHKGLKKEIIEDVISNQPVENYELVLRELLSKKSKELGKFEAFERKNRLIRFAVQRGFEYDLIFRIIDDFMTD